MLVEHEENIVSTYDFKILTPTLEYGHFIYLFKLVI